MAKQTGSKVPQIRFKGFVGDWEEKKLSELCDLFTDGDWIESKDQSASGIRLLQTGNVGVNEFIDKAEKARWISLDTFERLKCEEVFTGDILISRLPEPAGRACIVPKISHRVITAVDCTIVRTAKGCDPAFLVQHCSLDSYFETVNNYLGGGTRQRISRSALGNFVVKIPQVEEQQKIGEYFRELDSLIGLHQRKHDKLVTLKKAMLQKMFPQPGATTPEIRFKGFSGAWVEKPIGDVLSETKRSIVLEDNQRYELIMVKRRNQGVVSRGFLLGRDILVKNYSQLQAGDFLISKRQVVHGATGIVPEYLDGAIVSNEYLVAVGNSLMTTEFLTILSSLPDMLQKFFLSSYGVDIEKLFFDAEDWKNRSVTIPSLPEQQKIGTYFRTLDALIAKHATQLQKLQQIKSACLERMFV